MSEISRRIIDAVKSHLNEYGDPDVGIPLEGDLETELDAILLDAVFPLFGVKPDSEKVRKKGKK